jgi:hypothetical protein
LVERGIERLHRQEGLKILVDVGSYLGTPA